MEPGKQRPGRGEGDGYPFPSTGPSGVQGPLFSPKENNAPPRLDLTLSPTTLSQRAASLMGEGDLHLYSKLFSAETLPKWGWGPEEQEAPSHPPAPASRRGRSWALSRGWNLGFQDRTLRAPPPGFFQVMVSPESGHRTHTGLPFPVLGESFQAPALALALQGHTQTGGGRHGAQNCS